MDTSVALQRGHGTSDTTTLQYLDTKTWLDIR